VKTIFIDTSAFVKIFIEGEEASDVTEKIVELAKEKKIKIALSNWVVNESIALVDENERKGKINNIQALQIINEIMDMIEGRLLYSNFTFYAVKEEIVDYSRITIREFHLSASDALHVYIAQGVNCDCIISADKDLIYQVRRHSKTLKGFNIRINQEVKELFNLLS
jgi:predicted nucleic acid-binding protein